ncbi:MaoC family dehydratase [Flexivirga sp. ID2601S]|uniref:MaoC family dehydratase n=1 Tax=Flexivirga aerilata TaxID=1656889 RepID=A0A849AI77_9MICO|nr:MULTISPECIES: MaoC family dehydratase [Flexivirga]NNG38928.1 MaoC family dehydratase [Flexivirga aerilata]
MRTFNGIEELQAAVGEHLGYSEWHEITQEQVNLFADATGDHQWIHVDVERAKEGPFGGTIAHGYLTLSMIPMLSWEVYALEGVKMGINYGSNKVRFPTPVPVGSRVRGGLELQSVEPSSLGFTVTMKVTIEIDGQDKPACVAETLSVVVP